jgi:putative transposase
MELIFPPPSHMGRPRKWPLRWIVEAILYLLRGGTAVADVAALYSAGPDGAARAHLWLDNRMWLPLNDAVLLIGREFFAREASLTAGVIDRQR